MGTVFTTLRKIGAQKLRPTSRNRALLPSRRWKASLASTVTDDDLAVDDFRQVPTTVVGSQSQPTVRKPVGVPVHDEAWRVNLGRESDEWLTGHRPNKWFTGVHPTKCPGKLTRVCTHRHIY
jgi:hypothetical protein